MRIPRGAAYRGAVQIVRTLRADGHEAYLVGGCARDLLRGVAPTDYDVATSATPETVQRLFPRTVPVGAQFGVILVLQGPATYEVATFRTDEGYQDGRHPERVVFSTAEQDAQRRDFTINGLFWDPIGRRVLDYVDGQADLRRQLVRAIGDPARRFTEDKLRVLRAVRFAAVLDFTVEPQTWAAVSAHAPAITAVSHERIRAELIKLFTGPHPGRGLDLLDQSGLLAILLPEVAATKGVQQPPEFHPEGDVYVHTRLLLDLLKGPSPTLALAGLFHDVGKPPTFQVRERIRFDGHDRVGADMTERICRRLRLSNEETEKIVAAVGNHMRFKDVQRMRVSTLKRMLRQPNFLEELALHRADCLASHRQLDNWRFLRRKLKEFAAPQALKPSPLVTGRDLLAAGYPEGPMIGQILRLVEEQQLEGAVTSQAEAMTLIRREFPLPHGAASS
ncbi:MAG: CCA tRNA nucleotidyltransferase [Candidatus Omnitrophica bacterium]|nr:CCA tRNA nucleotidyltransferase [Candidatus Omnitrophota bacterium]